ncbi:hypothetical protein D9615_002492 [Tricholomella constricta]|uniref:Uncharacterized protein n=1 Tax=Tricholomella constricta TaxID=117010 RepID=A0A8H5HMH8_9AGAR|nr:hypothetical protein D9615_002492 [Tricholomella constricta]
MSVSVGGLGLMSLRNPFAELVGMVLGKTDLSLHFSLVPQFLVHISYLTNPTENSFRAYLTEQSFRQHLSRLDDNADDDHKRQSSSARPAKRTTFPTAHTLSYDNSSPFHFANRASISLRTPKHVFHSFGLFTIAAMVPLARTARLDERENLIISDSWYVGAFGRWWRGGIIEAWYQDVIARTKDEESWSSGILSMKNLDNLTEYNGLPFSTKNLPPHLLSRGSPPKLRNRERSSQRPAMLPARSSTPPPLPKSASLPLHTARLPSSVSDRPLPNSTQPILQNHTCLAADQVRLGSPLLSRSPSTLFDQSPRIAEVLRQITHSKATVLELRTQLSDCQLCASQSHDLLQGEVDSFRERKRQEDAAKLETKSRTKALDDSRRSAESLKKDAERKLKAAQNARDNATQRMDHLDKEITRLHQRLVSDEVLIHQSEENVSEDEKEIALALEQKKEEIKIAEDVVAALNQRARELEEKLTEEKERLPLLKERHQSRMLELSSHPGQVASHSDSSTPWTSAGYALSQDAVNGPSTPDIRDRHLSSTAFEAMNGLGRRPSITVDTPVRSANLAQGTSTFNSSPTSVYSNANATQAALRANGYSVFDDSILSAAPQQTSYPLSTVFSPFGDLDGSQPNGMSGVVSPTSQSLIPSTLITSLENGVGFPRSFQSESDVYMDREWRNNNAPSYKQNVRSRSNDSHDLDITTVTTSPVSPQGFSGHSVEHDPFEVRFMTNEGDYRREYGQDHQTHQLAPEHSMDMQRASWVNRSNSDPHPSYYTQEESDQPTSTAMTKAGRRWFSSASKEKPKKGLNPDAKVFSLARKSPPRAFGPGPVFNVSPSGNSIAAAYDALNPNGLSSTAMPAPASVTGSFTRVFAPSPAEREALQRALGGSTNASFERLPSLSDVGSIPSSPSHVHALPAAVPQHTLSKLLPAWLQSLPPRKANFSPWDDDEPEVGVVSGSGSGRHR